MKWLLPVSIHCTSQTKTLSSIREKSVPSNRVICAVSCEGGASMVHVSGDANQNENMGSFQDEEIMLMN
jgi:hypothetical protein